jgi:hypothetical protein
MLPSEFPELSVALQPSLVRLCRDHFDMQVQDVRVLLRMPKAGYQAGCNFAALAVLFNLIAGASVCFFDASAKALAERGNRGKRFQDMLETWYPWEPGQPPGDGANVLYSYARNPLAHSLGMDDPDGPEVGINKFPLSERRIETLETSTDRPAWCPPALTAVGSDFEVGVAGLYWGYHRLLHALFADPHQLSQAEQLAQSLHF